MFRFPQLMPEPLSSLADNLMFHGQAFAGVGAGGMNILVSTILTDILPLKERGVWQGYVNIVFATGASIGAPMGSSALFIILY